MDFLKDFAKKNWKQFLLWLIMFISGWLSSLITGLPFNPPIPPIPFFEGAIVDVDDPDGTPKVYPTGWRDDPEEVAAIAATLPFPAFTDTPAGNVIADLPKDCYLWQGFEQVMARPPPTKNQSSIGSCVSFGTNNAIIRTMAMQIAVKKQAEEIKDIVEEVTYGGSRVQIGKGRIRGDGSTGAWAAQFVQQYGVISREVHGSYDLSTYSVARCREFGSKGCPKDLEATAREHPVKEITQVKTWADAKLALAQGYGIAVCSNQGFSMKRDANGVANAQGSWAHCMCLDGYHTEPDGSEYGHIDNSWGPTAFSGPVGWGNPTPSGFWAKSAVADRMLKANDSWAFSDIKGFPAKRKTIDWFAGRSITMPALAGNFSHRLKETFLCVLHP